LLLFFPLVVVVVYVDNRYKIAKHLLFRPLPYGT
jgi:hypothetical protein